jgi:hypothetical protein
VIFDVMGDVCRLIWCLMAGLFRPRASLHAEILVLRHQLNVLQRKSPKRLVFNNIDRLVFAGLYGLAPNVLDALKILKPETVVRWHPRWFSRLLALEISISRRPATSIGRSSRAYS